MAPKKSKAQHKAQVSSSQSISAYDSQNRATRSKRRHSDASEDDIANLDETDVNSQPKRRRKAVPQTQLYPDISIDGDDTIVVSRNGNQELDEQSAISDGTNDDVPHGGSLRHVQFSEEVELLNDDETSAPQDASTSKMLVKRRTTISPKSATAKTSQKASSRTSLTVDVNATAQGSPVPSLPLASLRDVLNERVQQLLHHGEQEDKHDGTQSIQSTSFDDMMVVDTRDSIATASSVRLRADRLSTSQLNSPSRFKTKNENPLFVGSSIQWNAERRKFEDFILALSQEVDKYKTQLQVCAIELRSLGLSSEDMPTTTIISHIRQSFASIREALYQVVPDAIDADTSNTDMVQLCVSTLHSFATQITSQEEGLEVHLTIISQLQLQIDGLLDHLAASEVSLKQNEEARLELVEANISKDEDITQLNAAVAEAEKDASELGQALAERGEQLATAETESDHLQRSLERLKESLRDYRDEEHRLQELIAKMEEDHTASIAKMSLERETTVRELEDQYDEAVTLRTEAESASNQKQDQILVLEQEIRIREQEHTEILDNVQSLDARLEAEQDARQQADSALQVKNTELDQLEERVTTLEDELEGLNADLAELQQASQVDRELLDTTQSQLEESQSLVVEVETKLHTAGIDANKLRQKMFEVQQRHEAQIAELESAANEREEQYQSDMAQEVTRRDLAENAVRLHTSTISNLEEELRELEGRIASMVAERNALLISIEVEMNEKESNIVELTKEIGVVENQRVKEQMQAADVQEQLEVSVAALKDTIDSHEVRIHGLLRENEQQSELHSQDITEREAAIAQLDSEVGFLQDQISRLEADKLGLEHRVEDEASQMLQYQAEKQDEVDALHDMIKDKQQKVLVVEQKAREADMRWQDLLDERMTEITTLHTNKTEHTQQISTLQDQLRLLTDTFTAYVYKVEGNMLAAAQASAAVHEAVLEKQSSVEQDSRAVLAQLEQVAAAVEDSVQTSTSTTVQTSDTVRVSATKRGRKKRVLDSGIGLIDEV